MIQTSKAKARINAAGLRIQPEALSMLDTAVDDLIQRFTGRMASEGVKTIKPEHVQVNFRLNYTKPSAVPEEAKATTCTVCRGIRPESMKLIRSIDSFISEEAKKMLSRGSYH